MAAISEVILHQPPANLVYGESCSDLLQGYGIALTDFWEERFTLKESLPLVLNGNPATPLFRRILRTHDIHQFKNWIGISNSLIRSGKYLPPPEFPQTPARQLEKAKDCLSCRELADLQLAYNYYFFGNSDLVEDYRTALHIHYSPFEAVLYGGDLVEIFPQASIEVRERPAVLLFRELTIHAGGSLKLFTPCKVNVDLLHKVPASRC